MNRVKTAKWSGAVGASVCLFFLGWIYGSSAFWLAVVLVACWALMFIAMASEE